MLYFVIEAFKKSVMFLCIPLTNRNVGMPSDWAFEITLHSSSARLEGIHPVQIHLIRIQDSPDHRSVHKHRHVKRA